MEPIVMYSTNTWLAYRIAQEYYKGVHYVWCAPYFSSNSVSEYDRTNPPSSTPSTIYDRLYQEACSRDRHSRYNIEANKAGLRKGAEEKAKAKLITDQQRLEILAIIAGAERIHFKPLLYVIPYSSVTNLVKKADIEERADVLSQEFIIENLPRSAFDYIDYKPSTNL